MGEYSSQQHLEVWQFTPVILATFLLVDPQPGPVVLMGLGVDLLQLVVVHVCVCVHSCMYVSVC